MSVILMPALSPTMEEGALAKWHVRAGDRVTPGQLIAEIETDKATMEVEAVDEGVIEALLVAEGSSGVLVNTPIARLVERDRAAAPATETAPAPAAKPGEPKAEPPPTPAVAPKPVLAVESPAPSPVPAFTGDATPLARRIAHSAGIALESRAGSGPGGRILKRDLAETLGLSRSAPATAAPAAISRPAEAPARGLGPEYAPGSYDIQPLDGMRRTIARRMAESFRDVPHFPLTVDIELDRFLSVRERLNGALAAQGVKASVNDMIIKAAASALQRIPPANASFTPEGIARHHDVDIAFAVAIEGGLITPIVRKANEKGVGEIAAETKALAERARNRALTPSDFQGGTFTVSNLGMFGIKSFSSIINEPQGAILSVGAGEKRPVARGDDPAVATVATFTLTCDHRAMDGATAAEWVRVFKSLIEEPMGMLL